MRRRHSSRGFTLIELLVVIAIIGVLIALLNDSIVKVHQRVVRLAEDYSHLSGVFGPIAADLQTAERDLNLALTTLLPAIQREPNPEWIAELHFMLEGHVTLLADHEARLRRLIPTLAGPGGGPHVRGEKKAVIELHNEIVGLRTQLTHITNQTHKLYVLSQKVRPE